LEAFFRDQLERYLLTVVEIRGRWVFGCLGVECFHRRRQTQHPVAALSPQQPRLRRLLAPPLLVRVLSLCALPKLTPTACVATPSISRLPRPKTRAARTKRWLAASGLPHIEQILEAAYGGEARLAPERRLSAQTPVRVGLTSPLVGVGLGRTVAWVWKSRLPPDFGLGS